jgi:hypothetical protein
MYSVCVSSIINAVVLVFGSPEQDKTSELAYDPEV